MWSFGRRSDRNTVARSYHVWTLQAHRPLKEVKAPGTNKRCGRNPVGWLRAVSRLGRSRLLVKLVEELPTWAYASHRVLLRNIVQDQLFSIRSTDSTSASTAGPCDLFFTPLIPAVYVGEDFDWPCMSCCIHITCTWPRGLVHELRSKFLYYSITLMEHSSLAVRIPSLRREIAIPLRKEDARN